jgi:hypothetical protein
MKIEQQKLADDLKKQNIIKIEEILKREKEEKILK